MIVICVDDDPGVLERNLRICEESPLVEEAFGFKNGEDAIAYLTDHVADAAFLDISMPGQNGIVLAGRLHELQPKLRIIFLTAHSEYAVDAFKLHASGYLLKPAEEDAVLDELVYALSGREYNGKPAVEARTFGGFDLLVDGSYVNFKRSKAKELLAYLIDKRGGTVSRKDAFAALWEDEPYDRSMQKQFDVVLRSLRDTLEEYRIEHIFAPGKNAMRVVPEEISCDLYRFLDGDEKAVASFLGEYLSGYPWASTMEGFLTLKTM